MPRWTKVLRGMIGTSLTFSAGVGVVASAVAGVVWLLTGAEGGLDSFLFAGAIALWAFPIGMAFSGFLALTARHGSFEDLSMLGFAALGAGGGLLLFGTVALNASDHWTLGTTLLNAAIFLGLGSGSATTALWLARRAEPALGAGEEPRRLPDA
jgi:hypothetical protein